MVKSEKKMTKPEKINLSHNPSAHRCEQWSLHKPKMKSNLQHTKTLSAKKSEKNRWQDQVSLEAFYRPEKKPLTSAENVRNLKLKELFSRDVNEKEINYAGAKFSDPPSPSDLPKPPSHWVGSKGHHSDQCKALMTFHLKTLLKVQL
ncbi:hypothetical protein FKM82_010860 [Ascaphus truei]